MKIRKRMGGMMNSVEKQNQIIQKKLSEGKTMEEIIDEATYSTETYNPMKQKLHNQTIEEILNGAAHSGYGTYRQLNTPMSQQRKLNNEQNIEEILNGAAHSRYGTYKSLNKPTPKSRPKSKK